MGKILRSNSIIRRYLELNGTIFLEHACSSFERILPHTQVSNWKTKAGKEQPRAKWTGNNRRSIHLTLSVDSKDVRHNISSELARRKTPKGVGKISRTLDVREHMICQAIVKHLSSVPMQKITDTNGFYLRSSRDDFDEQVVAQHLQEHHDLQLDVFEVFSSIHKLAEQTYENKQLVFGCILDPNKNLSNGADTFPQKLLERKRYRVLSDGFRSAYHVANNGALLGFVDLEKFEKNSVSLKHFYPEWAENIARASRKGCCGICLNRNGDILVFDEANLRFTYRFGRWQYWNHNHIVDLLKNIMRVQRVPQTHIGKVAGAIYRVALDAAFRRTGALFVILHREKNLREIVLKGDAINDKNRHEVDVAFDDALPGKSILSLPRNVLVELSSLDGAIVLNSKGRLLAYGTVLNPKKKGKTATTEGSRTKAAIGASNYGISVKVSSDGDISIFNKGKEFLRI